MATTMIPSFVPRDVLEDGPPFDSHYSARHKLENAIWRSFIKAEAAATLAQYRALALAADGRVRQIDPTDPNDAFLLVGIALNGGDENDDIAVVTHGIIDNSSWTFTSGDPIFVGAAGELTQTVPTSSSFAFLSVIATPVTATRIFVNFHQPIFLED